MPRGDGTGPMGMGTMTGRAGGYCAGYTAPGFANAPGGRGMGMGRGRGGWGRGCGMGMAWRRGWAFPPAAYPGGPFVTDTGASVNEVEMLKRQAKYFGEALDGINKRIAEIEGAGGQ